jgi:methylated-DNA-[protein]-cysteine S-methyltransferase
MKQIIKFNVLEKKGKIVKIEFNTKKTNKKSSVLENDCIKQIKEYFARERKTFSIPIKFEGTPFQKSVWKEMQKIPYGKSISYKALAKRIGNPKSYRAVANACGKNSLPIIIPCHRVVASNGLGGYSAGIEIKKKLLEVEKIKVK